jgi:hypothetical protein
MKKKGINLRWGTYIKRLWFEIPDTPSSDELFDRLCDQIDDIDTSSGWHGFLRAVEMLFVRHGFNRVAR